MSEAHSKAASGASYEPELPADAPHRKKMSLSIQLLVLLLFIPFFLLTFCMAAVFYVQTYEVRNDTERLIRYVVPSILRTQRSFVNIENLKNLVTEIHDTLDRKKARDTYINARAFLAELALEDHLSLSTIRAIDTNLVTFWERRQELERLHEGFIRSYLRMMFLKNLIDHMFNPEVQSDALPDSMLRVMLVSTRSISNFDANLADMVSENIGVAKRRCEMKVNAQSVSAGREKDGQAAVHTAAVTDAERRQISAYCERFMRAATRFNATRRLYRDVQDGFNLSFAGLRESVDGMIVQATQSETSTLSGRLSGIAKTARESEPLMYAAAILLLLIAIVDYMLLLRYVSLPLRSISEIIRNFRERRRRPESYPHSVLREIEAINGVLPKIFEDVNLQAHQIRSQTKNYQTLLNISYKDDLTGVKNRRALDDLIKNMKVVPSGMAVLMVDIDNFKAFNDMRGHQYGDFVLSTIGRELRANVSNEDSVYRYGGEEFMILLQEVGDRVLKDIGQRLCDVIYNIGVENPANATGRLTISVGASLSTTRDGEFGWEEMIGQADKALYDAKHGGRNQVVCTVRDAGETGEPGEPG